MKGFPSFFRLLKRKTFMPLRWKKKYKANRSSTNIIMKSSSSLGDLPPQIITEICYFLAKEDLITLLYVSKSINDTASLLLYKSIHIVLISHHNKSFLKGYKYHNDETRIRNPIEYIDYIKEVKRQINRKFNGGENIQLRQMCSNYSSDARTYFKKSATVDSYPFAINYESRKNIKRVIYPFNTIRLLDTITDNPKLAGFIKSFTIELYRGGSQTVHIYEHFDLVEEFDPKVVKALLNSKVYQKLVNCRHISLPLELIPNYKLLTCLITNTNLTSVTLNTKPISNCVDYLYSNSVCEKKFAPICSPLKKSMSWRLFEETQSLHRRNQTSDYAYLSVYNKSKYWEIIGKVSYMYDNAIKLTHFLGICANNPSIKKIFFNGFEGFSHYCQFLLGNTFIEPVYMKNVDILTTPDGLIINAIDHFISNVTAEFFSRVPELCFQHLKEFAARLSTDPDLGGFDTLVATNSETKFLASKNGIVYSFFDFIEFLFGFSSDSYIQLFKVKNLTINANQEELLVSRYSDGSKIVGNDRFKTFMKEIASLRIDISQLNKFQYSWLNSDSSTRITAVKYFNSNSNSEKMLKESAQILDHKLIFPDIGYEREKEKIQIRKWQSYGDLELAGREEDGRKHGMIEKWMYYPFVDPSSTDTLI